MKSIINVQHDNLFERQWLAHKKYAYLLALFFPSIPLLLAFISIKTQQGAWFWAILPLGYVLVPALDFIVGKDRVNPNDAQIEKLKTERYYVHILYGVVFMIWASVIGVAFVISHWRYLWTWDDIVGAAISVGLINGIALTVGHELGHKVRDKYQTLASKLTLASCAYGHFIVEHNKGHHKNVATPDDPASSRMGENIYQFAVREIPGALQRAWLLEAERLARLGKNRVSLHNELIQQWGFSLLVFSAMTYLWGTTLIPFFVISCAFGWWQLTSANYVEHYGLLRQKDLSDPNRFQRCEPKHSWNSNYKLSNLLLVHLQRHSDHHAYPTYPYQVLRDYDDVPQLPQGYFGMFVCAYIPPIWFAVMDKRVVAWAHGDLNKVNLQPSKRARLMRRYHQPL